MLTLKQIVRKLLLPTLYAVAIVFGVAMLSRYVLHEELSRGFYLSQVFVYFLVVVPGCLRSAKKDR